MMTVTPLPRLIVRNSRQIWRIDGRAGFESSVEALRVEGGVAYFAALEVGPDAEGARFLVRCEGGDLVAELGRQLRKRVNIAIVAAIVYECVERCDVKSWLCVVDCVVGFWCC
jgi:hypothetical protein